MALKKSKNSLSRQASADHQLASMASLPEAPQPHSTVPVPQAQPIHCQDFGSFQGPKQHFFV